MFLNKEFKKLSKKEQINFLKNCLKSLKDDDINKYILENKLKNLKNDNRNKYKKMAKTFDVNH